MRARAAVGATTNLGGGLTPTSDENPSETPSRPQKRAYTRKVEQPEPTLPPVRVGVGSKRPPKIVWERIEVESPPPLPEVAQEEGRACRVCRETLPWARFLRRTPSRSGAKTYHPACDDCAGEYRTRRARK